MHVCIYIYIYTYIIPLLGKSPHMLARMLARMLVYIIICVCCFIDGVMLLCCLCVYVYIYIYKKKNHVYACSHAYVQSGATMAPKSWARTYMGSFKRGGGY